MPYGYYEVIRECQEVKTWQEVTRVYAENEEKAKDYANEQTYDLQGCNVEWEMVNENWSEVDINSWRSWEVEELEWYDDGEDDDDDDDDEGEEESEENELVDDEPAVKIIPTHFLQNIKL